MQPGLLPGFYTFQTAYLTIHRAYINRMIGRQYGIH